MFFIIHDMFLRLLIPVQVNKLSQWIVKLTVENDWQLLQQWMQVAVALADV